MSLGQWWGLQNWCLDFLEGSFALNLIALAATIHRVKLSKTNQSSQIAAGHTSVSVVFSLSVRRLGWYHSIPEEKVHSIEEINHIKETLVRQVEEVDYDVDTLPD